MIAIDGLEDVLVLRLVVARVLFQRVRCDSPDRVPISGAQKAPPRLDHFLLGFILIHERPRVTRRTTKPGRPKNCSPRRGPTRGDRAFACPSTSQWRLPAHPMTRPGNSQDTS